jgi:hypothetical protein
VVDLRLAERERQQRPRRVALRVREQRGRHLGGAEAEAEAEAAPAGRQLVVGFAVFGLEIFDLGGRAGRCRPVPFASGRGQSSDTQPVICWPIV